MRVLVVLAFAAVALARAPFFAHHGEEVTPDQYIVKLNQDLGLNNGADVVTWLEKAGIVIPQLTFWKTFNAFSFNGQASTVRAIRELPEVKYVEADLVVRIPEYWNSTVEAKPSPFDAQTAGDWGQSRIDSREPTNPAVFGPCDDATSCDFGSGSVIYIVDTGVRFDHIAFGGRAVFGANFITGNPPVEGDCNGHGTHCAGSAAGQTPEGGARFSDYDASNPATAMGFGVASKAEIVSVRVLNCAGSGTTTGVIEGYEWVVLHARQHTKRAILSASLGGGFSQVMNDVVEEAILAGVIVTVAAGNNNADACNYSPASAPNAITVGATNGPSDALMDVRASFSNYGTCLKVFAPGVNIRSAWYTSNNAVNVISGTSMATPLTAGALALMPHTADFLTQDQAIQAIRRYGTHGEVTNPGTGSPNTIIYDRWHA